MHRFANGGIIVAESLRWNTLGLWSEIQNGLALAAKKYGQSIVSVGVDTWGVDYALLSRSGELLGVPFHYRDARTRGILPRAFARVPREDIFAETGLQFMEINTLFQLLALQKSSPELLIAAETLLMTPDFLNFCLCGARVSEFTIATTSQCVNPKKRAWASDLLRRFGLPFERIFPEIVPPGSRIGPLRASLADRTGLARINVVAPAAHDTGSAVAGTPTRHTGWCNWAYLSSGTWSLLGVELPEAQLSPRVLELNFTNEGGVDGTYRLLKNIMGLWLLQQMPWRVVRRERPGPFLRATRATRRRRARVPLVRQSRRQPFPESARHAESHPRLLPRNRPARAGNRRPVRPLHFREPSADLRRAVLEGLETGLTGTKIEVLHIVGAAFAQSIVEREFTTANASGRLVISGPTEATVFGNVLVQARSNGELRSLKDIRGVVRESSEVVEVPPQNAPAWQDARARFAILRNRKPVEEA